MRDENGGENNEIEAVVKLKIKNWFFLNLDLLRAVCSGLFYLHRRRARGTVCWAVNVNNKHGGTGAPVPPFFK